MGPEWDRACEQTSSNYCENMFRAISLSTRKIQFTVVFTKIKKGTKINFGANSVNCSFTWVSLNFNLKKFLIVFFPSFPYMGISVSKFFQPSNSVVVHTTLAKMLHIRQTRLIRLNVRQMPSLSRMYLLLCFADVLGKALLASYAINDISSFTVDVLFDVEGAVCFGDVNVVTKGA